MHNNTSAFGPCSEREHELTRKLAPRSRIVLVPNAPTLVHRSPSVRKNTDRSIEVVGVGRLHAQKGPEFFCEAIMAVRESGQRVSAKWVGGGLPKYEALLRANGIKIVPWAARSTAMEVLGNADLYLHSASWEGFPITVLEAVALGVPVIARNIAALSEAPELTFIQKPADVASRWHEWDNSAKRQAIAKKQAELLSRHTPECQSKGLKRLYTEGA